MKYLFPLIAYTAVAVFTCPLNAKDIKADDTKITATQEIVSETQENKEEKFTEEQIKLLSQAYGHMIGENLSDIGLSLDNNQILQGIQDAFSGVESPLGEKQTLAMFSKLQEDRFRQECKENLKAAEDFLAANAQEEGTVILEENKLHFKQITEGSGQTCRVDDTPIVTYKGSYLSGETFGESDDSGNGEPISLKDTIIGFQKAIVGMKVGETRKVFIHPDYAYGAQGALAPNALLTFEIALKGIEKTPEDEKDQSIGGMGTLPNENAFSDAPINDMDHTNLK